MIKIVNVCFKKTGKKGRDEYQQKTPNRAENKDTDHKEKVINDAVTNISKVN